MPISRPLSSAIAVGICSLAFLAPASAQPVDSAPSDPFGQAAAEAAEADAESAPFTGTLTVQQKGGSLYYKVYVVEGRAIGGYDTWRGSSKPYHRVVGGWYDGERMTLLMQSTQNDLEDKWFSHAHHFRKQDDGFVIEQTLYDDGKTIESGEVYQPHIADEIVALPADEVRRLAEDTGPGDVSKPQEATDASPPREATVEAAKAQKSESARAERENARLKTLVAELLLENESLKRRLSEK